MGRLFVVTLEGSVYSCKHCKTHLGLSDDIISKREGFIVVPSSGPRSVLPPPISLGRNWMRQAFHCRHGKAYLFDKVVNVTVGEKEERMMITGMHTVVDIFCVGCGSIVGWKYESAHEKGQKYKEGKFILERFKVLGPDGSMYVLGQEVQVGGSDADDA